MSYCHLTVQVNGISLTAVKEVRPSICRFSWNSPKINTIISRYIIRNFSQIEQQAQYGVQCSHIHEAQHIDTAGCNYARQRHERLRAVLVFDCNYGQGGRCSIPSTSNTVIWPTQPSFLPGVTNICGCLLYRILSKLDDIFTAQGQNSVRPLSKAWLWPHPLFTKPEIPQRQYVTIFCAELNHRCSSNAGSTDRSSFGVLSKASLSLSRS